MKRRSRRVKKFRSKVGSRRRGKRAVRSKSRRARVLRVRRRRSVRGGRRARGGEMGMLGQALSAATNPQHTKTVRSFGRALPRSAMVSTLVRANMQSQIRRVSGMNAYDNFDPANPGNVGFNDIAWRYSNSGQTSYVLPCYCWDLCSTNNIVRSIYTLGAPGARPYVFQAGTSSSGISWTDVAGQNSAGSLTVPAYWTDVLTSGQATPSNESTACFRDLLSWVRIKLNCYAPTSIPSNWDVSIVQFKDDWLVPKYTFDAAQGGLNSTQQGAAVNGTDLQTDASNFWQWFLKPYVKNPIDTEATGSQYAKRVIFHRTVKWEMQPTLTITSDAAPKSKQVEIFWRPNRICQYDWQPTGGIGFDGAVGSYGVNAGNTSTTVRPRDRLYLIIRASTNSIAPFGTANNALIKAAGKFDYLIDTKHVTLA